MMANLGVPAWAGLTAEQCAVLRVDCSGGSQHPCCSPGNTNTCQCITAPCNCAESTVLPPYYMGSKQHLEDERHQDREVVAQYYARSIPVWVWVVGAVAMLYVAGSK